MLNPTEILEQMEDVSTRIAAVAKDFESGTDRFAEVDPYRLAELLGSPPEEFESRTNYGHPVLLDDYCDTIYYYLAPLKGKVTDERIKELEERSEAFERGEVETDAELTPSEKKIIEAALSQQQLEDGGGCGVVCALASRGGCSESCVEVFFMELESL